MLWVFLRYRICNVKKRSVGMCTRAKMKLSQATALGASFLLTQKALFFI